MSDNVSPYVAMSADSVRTEQDVRDAKVIPMQSLIKDMLTSLLDEKVRTQEAWNEAMKRCNRLTSTDDPDERIAADIAKRIAYEAARDAEDAYNAGIAEHVKRLREARNVDV